MLRFTLVVSLMSGCLLSQELTPPAAPVLTLDVAPLAPPDLASPYAGPRDAARHRFQATLAQLQSSRNMQAAMQGFAEAFVTDRTYAAAAFNLGILAAIGEKWEDALAAFEEAARLDPAGLGKMAAPSLERLRKIAAMEATPAGKLERRYDEALYPILQKLPKLQPAEAMQAIAEAGRVDPKRWEAPALMAGLSGKGHGYDVAAKFLEIAVANTADPQLKARLQKALDAAQRELRYDVARAAADAAADRAEYEKAGELYENAWAVIPARSSNGMEGASAWLLHDDTAHASGLLLRLKDSGDPELAPLAGAMLKELDPIEPAAKAAAPDAREFFRDAGSTQPPVISDLIPKVDTTMMEVLSRPLPKLVLDTEPVVLLTALSTTPGDTSTLPELPPLRIAGEHPWHEIQQLLTTRSAESPAEVTMNSAELPAAGKVRRPLQVSSKPLGARLFLGESLEPVCETPCTIQAAAGTYNVRATLVGYRYEARAVRVGVKGADLEIPLEPIRGNVLVEAPGATALRVNGTPIPAQQAEWSLIPGVYRITADFGPTTRERTLNVKPEARLHLELHP